MEEAPKPIEEQVTLCIENFSQRYYSPSRYQAEYRLIDGTVSPNIITNFGSLRMEWILKITEEKRDGKPYWEFELGLLASSSGEVSDGEANGHTDNRSLETNLQSHTSKSKIKVPFRADCQIQLFASYCQIYDTDFMTFTFDRQCNWALLGWPNRGRTPGRICADDIINNNRLLFPEDKLNVGLKIIYPGHTTSASSIQAPPNSKGLGLLLENMLELLKTGKGSDFTIHCGSSTFPVHKIILSARSPVFDAMFSVEMKEKATNELTVTDLESRILNYMLEYVYTSKLSLGLDKISREDLAELFKTADKYQLEELKDSCFQIFVDDLNFENCGRAAVIGFLCNANRKQKDTVYQYISANWLDLAGMEDFKESVKSYPAAFLKP